MGGTVPGEHVSKSGGILIATTGGGYHGLYGEDSRGVLHILQCTKGSFPTEEHESSRINATGQEALTYRES